MTTIADIINGAEYPQQDYILLGGLRSPGLAEISGLSLERRLDIRQGYGSTGGEIIYLGETPAKFDVRFSLWAKSHFSEWQTFAKSTLTAKSFGSQKNALTIQHPLLSLEPLKITAVVVEKVSQFEQDESGLWQCTVSFVQWLKPRPVVSKALAAIPTAAQKIPTAQDAADLEIQRLTQQFSALAAQ